MFRFFKNKKMEKRIKEMEESLSHSFSQIKKDFLSTHRKVNDHHSHHNNKLDEIYNRVLQLEKLFSSITTKDLPKKEATEFREIFDHLSSLTDSQKRLFMEIISLHLESGLEWISLTDIAKQAYPEKDYNTIRSTLSEYTSTLEETGLLHKKIQRKKAYVKSTIKGAIYLDEGRAKKLKKIIKE
ncbi:MAG: hypothetical protein CMH62_02830 [Nanoarchaeota archaeon]|nr:hypothetical protein [Nanoarchaeota archaeon]|tara:strand:- start:817 stop:1368 length:552 start_codon:yes stop_codon:yes gene_type:complete